MYVKIIAKTVKEKKFSEKLKFWKNYKGKDAFDDLSGKHAGVCYMKDTYEVINKEPRKKTLGRIKQTKVGGHHSVYDHNFLTLELSGISKAMAMLLNNEKWYVTSEKSGRYTVIKGSKQEEELYNKWCKIFEEEISKAYKNSNPKFFTDLKIKKLAMENARYLNSIYSRGVIMVYTISYRQLNYLYGFFKELIEKGSDKKFYQKLMPEIKEFYNELSKLPYIDELLIKNGKNRTFTLINTKPDPEEYFGDVYQTTFKATIPCFAQNIRHRTLWCSMNDIPKKPTYYVPPIISVNKELSKQWLTDISSNEENVPQGMLFTCHEAGTLDSFVLKLYERKCTTAQLEINELANLQLKKYSKALKSKKHARAEELSDFMKGSRCTFSGYTCTMPCGFKEGINETRKI